MNVWLVTVGEPLPIDERGDRLWRAGLIATMLADKGDTVMWWTSDFDHINKRHRFGRYTERSAGGIEYRILHGIGYSRNISPRRQIDHIQIAAQFSRKAKSEPRPDIILVSMPTVELALAAVRYGRNNGVPVVVDVRDLWPDIFIEAMPDVVRPIAKVALAPLEIAANAACRGATAITGNSDDFVAWGVKRAGRALAVMDRVFPFGYAKPHISEDETAAHIRSWRERGVKDDGSLTICFFGSMTDRFDFDTVLSAAMLLHQRKSKVRFVLCGKGPNLEKIMSAAIPNVIAPGWVNAAEIESLMQICHAGIAPYKNGVGFDGNVPNKPIEYISGGLAVLTCLDGALSSLVDEYDIGLRYRQGSYAGLADAVELLASGADTLEEKRRNAKTIFDRFYRAESVYGQMIEYMRGIARGHEPATRQAE